MNSRAACIGLILLATVFTGCLPEAKITWSPDGKYALVRGGDGLRLCDAAGNLSPPIAENVRAVAWMPDSKQFIAACGKSVTTWEALLGHLSDERKGRAKALAEDFRRQILAYKGSWDGFSFQARPDDIMAALMCLRDEYGKELAPVVGKKWAELQGAQHTIFSLQLFEVADGTAKAGKVLCESIEPVAEIRVAPTGKAFGYAAPPYPPKNADPAFSLFVASMAAPDKPSRVGCPVSIFFDWTPDGQSVVFANAAVPDPNAGSSVCSSMPVIGLGTEERAVTYNRFRMRDRGQQFALRAGNIVNCRIVNQDGNLAAEPHPQYEASVLFFDSLPVRCLRNGTILFACTEAHLPAAQGEAAGRFGLFSLDPADPKTAKPVTMPKALEEAGTRLELLQLSPDETRAAIPTNSGKVFILNLVSDEATEVPVKIKNGRFPTIPVWRTNDELCFVVPAGSALGSPNGEEVVLWSPAGSRCLSKDWPEPATKGFLNRNK